MELKNDSIREVLSKEGIGVAKSKFGTELLTNELKKDFSLVKEVITKQPCSGFNYCIFGLLPLEVSKLYEKEIMELAVDMVMQENPTANREEVIELRKKDFEQSIVRREYLDKSPFYTDLYLGIDYAKSKYGADKVEAILSADSKLKQNLIDFGRIKEEEQAIVDEKELTEEKSTTVKEEQKTEQTLVEDNVPVEETPIDVLPEKKPTPIDPRKLSPKALKLIKKVKILCEKCANENNIVKKHLLKFKLRILTTRLQEEIDLYYLKEEYRIKAKEIKAKVASKQQDDILDIINLNKKIKQRESILRANSEYDYYSSDFMFPKSLVEKYGGINEFAKQLEGDNNPDIQAAGKNIYCALKYREQIDLLKNKISDKQKEMEMREKESFEESAKLEFMNEENHLALKQPNAMFSKIKEFFKIAKISIQDFKNEIAERRELSREYKQKEVELREQFDLQMKQLKQDAKKAKSSSITKRDTSFMDRMRENVNEETIIENAEHEIPEKQSEAEER